MINVFCMITIVLTLSLQNVANKGYTQKNSGGVYLFGVLTCLSAALFFMITSGSFKWSAGVVPYALAFAVAYCIATIFSVMAIDCGSLSLTNLMISYSLMIPAMYGVFFLNEKIRLGFYPGILLLVVSLFLINPKGDKENISFKWIVYVILAAVGNGMCSTVQKMQQIKYEGAYKNEFMIIALISGAIVLIFFVLLKEREEVIVSVKQGWLFGVSSGLCNGILNLFVMILSGRMSASLMFPLISAGGIIVTYIISKFIYKENLTKRQFVGFVLGIGSVIFLNM